MREKLAGFILLTKTHPCGRKRGYWVDNGTFSLPLGLTYSVLTVCKALAGNLGHAVLTGCTMERKRRGTQRKMRLMYYLPLENLDRAECRAWSKDLLL